MNTNFLHLKICQIDLKRK